MGKVPAKMTDTVSKALHSFLNADPLGNQSHIKEEKAVDHPECRETDLQSLGRSACLAIVVLLSCLPLVKTTSLTTPCWDRVIVLPRVSVIPWTWRQLQEQEEQGQGSEAQGKGCVGPGARHPGQAPPGRSQNQGDQASRLDSSIRRQWLEARWFQKPRPMSPWSCRFTTSPVAKCHS